MQCRAGLTSEKVGPEFGQTSAFYNCILTGVHGPTCIFWANLTNFSLRGCRAGRGVRTVLYGDTAADVGDRVMRAAAAAPFVGGYQGSPGPDRALLVAPP